MTRVELEARVRELERKVTILEMQQEGDATKFAELIIIKELYKESVFHLKALKKITKAIAWIGSAVIGMILFVRYVYGAFVDLINQMK